ncbi:mannose-6-phosphate isomerase, partial [Kipferlia bialata]
VYAPIFLQHHTCQAGEVLPIPPGVPHAHLVGEAAEIMVSSDNVIRAGLTPKYIDRQALVEAVVYGEGERERERETPLVAVSDTKSVLEYRMTDYGLGLGLIRRGVSDGMDLHRYSDASGVILSLFEGAYILTEGERSERVEGPCHIYLDTKTLALKGAAGERETLQLQPCTEGERDGEEDVSPFVGMISYGYSV